MITTRTEAKNSGLKFVGQFGLPGHENSEIWAKPEDFASAKKAYDEIDEDNLRLDCVDDVLLAGGVWVADL